MSNLEPGCKAVVVVGRLGMERPSNVGKLVTVGNFIGRLDGFEDSDFWEVSKPTTCLIGPDIYYQNASKMQRIDGNDNETIETKKELEVKV